MGNNASSKDYTCCTKATENLLVSFKVKTAPNVFSYIHVETDSEDVSREHTSRVSDYLSLDNVFDCLALG